eukprot:377194-Pyramimonas_sp.AAC.1
MGEAPTGASWRPRGYFDSVQRALQLLSDEAPPLQRELVEECRAPGQGPPGAHLDSRCPASASTG